jgi:Family of unknown function (DUF5320)
VPGGDRTGPLGRGPRTGRGIRYGSGCDWPGHENSVPRFHFGYGSGLWGTGRGWRHRYYATGIPGWVPPTQEQEIANLKAQAEWLKNQLDAIQKRIDEISD